MGDFRSLKLVLFFALLSFIGSAQLTESFDDGNFNQNPIWSGNDDIFIVNQDFKLQLNDVDVSKSEAYLSVNAPTGTFGTWRFSIKLDFSPSGSNFCRVYLNANQSDLTVPLESYIVQIGGISGDEDAVELVKQSGSDNQVLISGRAGGAATDIVDLVIEVSLDQNSMWTLNVDYKDGQGFINEGTAEETGSVEGKFFGWVCNYTSSRSDAFSLDDIFIDPIIIDDTPPELLSAEPLSNNAIELCFDEDLDFGGLSAMNFSLDNGISVVSISEGDDNNKVILNISPALTDQTSYTVSVNNIPDLVGNVLQSGNQFFDFVEISIATEFTILINEFMADPTPQIGLPNAEYIELFNNSSSNFQLSDYSIASGGSPVSLPAFVLAPGEYILLTKSGEAVNFQNFGSALDVEGFPSLTNSGDEITLLDSDQNVVHSINYNLDWYQDTDKEDGGYSIELINPMNACKGQANYRASTNLSGGTPTIINSVDSDEQDATAPELESLFTLDNSSLLLVFSEPLTTFSAEEVFNYSLSNGLSVSSAQVQTNTSQVILTLSENLIEGTIYALQFENIADCLGNTGTQSEILQFALPQIPKEGDLVINEVLFNPASGGVDYVEFYNTSDRVFNLADLQIGNLIPDVNESEAVLIDHLIFPETYVCITEDKSDILSRFTIEDPSTIFESDLPKLDDKEGNVTLIAIENLTPLFIDSFDYNEDLHSGFISDKNGVALERISFASDTNEAANWTSGAQATGFGTPGYENAQVIKTPTISSGDLYELINPTFSPDQDGFKDFLQIRFELDQTDYLGSMKIFDDQGREVRQLLPSQILSPNATVNWDGTIEDGSLANMGIYILWMELLSSQGERKVFKEPIVVARNLN